jgi:hypothetical protein
MTDELKAKIRISLPIAATEVTEKLGGVVPVDLRRIWRDAA